MAIRREVVATWKPSLSPDVKAQRMRWYINGRLIKRVTLRARVNRRSWLEDNPNVFIKEGDTIQCMICAVDEVGESPWLTAQVDYPYQLPVGPTDLGLEKLPIHLNIT